MSIEIPIFCMRLLKVNWYPNQDINPLTWTHFDYDVDWEKVAIKIWFLLW